MMLSLTAFLLRRSASPTDVWSEAASADMSLFLWVDNELESLSLDDPDILDAAIPGDVVVALLRRYKGMPRWQKFIKDSLNLSNFGVAAAESLGAAMFCAVPPEDGSTTQVRWVVWTFGAASRSLCRSALDPRFGLLAVLNLMVLPLLAVAIEPSDPTLHSHRPQLREIRYRTNAPYVQQSGHRAARDIPVDGFRVDRSSDLIATVGGSGADPALTTSTLLGGRSLRFRAGITQINDLVELSAIAMNRSRSVDYKEAFSWIDNIQLVDDADLEARLRGQLATGLISDPDLPSVDTILPDDLIEAGDDRSIRYIVFPHERRTGQGRTTLATATVAGFLSHSDDLASALDAELRFLDESSERIGSATLLECLSASLELDGRDYIAYDGDFYQVNRNFVERIDDELGLVSRSEVVFPAYQGETEPAYNSMVGQQYPQEFIELDRALITTPGEYGVESSDLVSACGALIHVKRKGKSSVLSHLFLQAANSCELLRRTPEAWEQVWKMMEMRALDPGIAARAAAAQAKAEQSREAEVVFGFLGDWKGKTLANLPLFSRISLVSEARRIRNLGFQVTAALISVR